MTPTQKVVADIPEIGYHLLMEVEKKIVWVGDSLKHLRELPEQLKDSIGYSLHKVQMGLTPKNAKPLKGIKPAVMEIVSDHNTDTYRTVYTIKIASVVYVLHCFKKKSKQGIKTPKFELDLIKQRLLEAQELAKKGETK